MRRIRWDNLTSATIWCTAGLVAFTSGALVTLIAPVLGPPVFFIVFLGLMCGFAAPD